MQTPTPASTRTMSFREPQRYFSGIDPSLAATMVSAGVDVALIVEDGVIRDLALGNAELAAAGCEKSWIGQRWQDTVTPDSQAKVAQLLEADPDDAGRWRQITQRTAGDDTVPVKYTTIRLGGPNCILALGQDLRSVATLQQRLVAMHQDLEREYASLRDNETRFRSLFNALSEGVAIVAGSDRSVFDMNPAAAHRLGLEEADISGRSFLGYIARGDRAVVDETIERALTEGAAEAKEVHFLAGGSGDLYASAFRQGRDIYAIVRIVPDGILKEAQPVSARAPNLREVLSQLPDGLVITTAGYRVLSANEAFLRMVQATDEKQIVGESLSLWLGRSPSEVSILQSNLKRHGLARNFATVVKDANGLEEQVEVSAVAAELDGETVFGFSIRTTSKRLIPTSPPADLPASRPEDVRSLVGQMPLKDIVRASTDLIEKLCIEVALDISDQSRASAAEILGLSRQGLYSKLKRFKIPEGQ